MKEQGHHPAVTAVPSPPHPLCPITGIQPRRVGGAKECLNRNESSHGADAP